MLKIVNKKRYDELLETETKYKELAGTYFTFYTGERSRLKAYLSMNKEELVRIIFNMNKIILEMKKRDK